MMSAKPALLRNALCALTLASAPLLVSPVAARSSDHSYVVMAAGGDTSTMSGSTDDYRRAKAYRQGDEGLIYFREKGIAYLVRDADMLRRADAIIAPQRALGVRQGALGREQGELGARQGALGAQQAALGTERADGWSQRMSELGRQQAALGAQQAALGSKQAELGRQQAAAARIAEKQLSALFAEAIRRGLAQRVQ